ncbi:MAG: hypothetical protein HOF89_05225, partial [Candidatus Nitrosopelagicus sp.]|nr:hypothetical protein [Candidatus Nitrosopelagicus sp.]
MTLSGKTKMKKQNKKQPIQSDESDGEKMSENPTLVRKGIRTYYGIVEDSLENKKENYDEICHAEDRRIVNAAIALRSRLSSKEREIAQEWYRNFSTLVGGW